MRGLQQRGIVRRNKILAAAITLFLRNGYEKTTTAQIAQIAELSPSSFFAAFENKEALLLALTETMFSSQFSYVEQQEIDDPLRLYCTETALQMHIAELSDSIREVYVMAYSLPTTTDYINRMMTERLGAIFGRFNPDAEEKDFYELEIASAGITRGFMAKPCGLYFTMEQKLRRYLDCCLKLYNVPKELADAEIESVCRMELHDVAAKLIDNLVQRASIGLEAALVHGG